VPTTSVIVKKAQDKVSFDLIHHNGTQYAPIHGGLITLNDLNFIKRKGEVMAKMGDSIKLSFKPEKCKVHQEGNYSCFAEGPIEIGNLEVKNFGFQTYQSESFLYGTSFREFNFSFYITTLEGENMKMNMTYDLTSSECFFN
jgi:hypothetical protein